MNEQNNFNGVNNPVSSNQQMNNNWNNQPQPIITNSQIQDTNNFTTNYKTKNGNKKRISIIIAILVVIVLGIILSIKLIFSKNSEVSSSDDITATNSFFIKNNEGMYALFDIDGNKLTDFIFTKVGDFVNGTSLVTNESDQKGLISTDGKLILNFNTYEYLYRAGALYEASDSEYNNYLLDSQGKVLLTAKDLNVHSYIGENLYTLVESEDKYHVYDYKGNVLASFPVSEDDDVDSPTAQSKENYVSIFYNNANYIFDISKETLVMTFNDKYHYCINDVNKENNEEFTLNTCTSFFGSVEEHLYKFVKKDKVVFTKTGKYSGSLYFNGNNVIFSDNVKSVLTDNGEIAFDEGYVIYKDFNNYIKEAEGILNGAELYVNGVLKEKVDCDDIQGGYAMHGVYLLDHCSGYDGSGSKIFMNYDGTVLNNKSYKRASAFDQNGYATVSDDGKKFYLINLNGEKVSEEYNTNNSADKIYYINGTKNLYHGTNDEKTETIFEINGKKSKELLKVSNTYTYIEDKKPYIIIEIDNKYTVYDLNNNKDISTLNSKPTMSSKYFTTSDNSKTQYYSYVTGKMFYEG